MPLGDSITDGSGVPGGYRVLLEQLLTASGARFDLVGTLRNGPLELGDQDHEGHSGWRILELEVGARSWVAQLQPNVVVVLAGTNDVWQRFYLDSVPQRLLSLLEAVNQAAPGVRVVVSTLPPLPDRAAERDAFNASLVHPNQAGHEKLAAGLYPTVLGVSRP